MTVQDILNFWEARAPLALAEEWDNPGLLVGSPTAQVSAVLTTLDITPQAVKAAAAMGAQLIVSHHPVIFSPLRRLEGDSVPYRLAAAGIAALCLHTNLDKAAGGVNDALIRQMGWPPAGVAPDGLCRIVTLPAPVKADELAHDAAQRLHTAVRFAAGGRDTVTRIGVCSGAGGDCLLDLAESVDAVLTGEIKHHEWLAFTGAGVAAIDAGHYATEVGISHTLQKEMEKAFPSLTVAAYAQPAPYETIRE
mgnify:CR=1 FL=1